MGEAEYEVVGRFIKAFGGQDFETAAPLLHPDVVFHEPAGLPHGGEWKGLDGIAALGEKIATEYSFEIREAELFDAGDRVLVEATVEFTSNRSGASMTQTIAEIYRVEGGQVVEDWIFYHDVPGLAGLHEAVPAA
jgi:limonene-1,2-epoxide hydrolase